MLNKLKVFNAWGPLCQCFYELSNNMCWRQVVENLAEIKIPIMLKPSFVGIPSDPHLLLGRAKAFRSHWRMMATTMMMTKVMIAIKLTMTMTMAMMFGMISTFCSVAQKLSKAIGGGREDGKKTSPGFLAFRSSWRRK